MKLTDLGNTLPELFPGLKARDIGACAKLTYPKIIHILKMDVKSFTLEGFGAVMEMETSMCGLMKLSTFSFTPNTGLSVPFLLVDTMTMGKKRLAYVEFYDCRNEKCTVPEISALAEKYKMIDNYNEKTAWYVHERMEGSLIKTAEPEDEKKLVLMVKDALAVYKKCIDGAAVDAENLKGLDAFRERMIKEGNPSSGTLKTVLGAEGAEDFFRKIVMPSN